MTIIRKVIQDTLEIGDPIAFVSANKNNRETLSILERKYVNKCYRSCLILKIVRILRQGHQYINQNGINDVRKNPVCGHIDVEFEVEGIVYNSREIITGCIVRENDEYGNIYADSLHADIHVSASKNNRAIRVGQKISIVVEHQMYEIFSNRISLSATLFVPESYCVAYEIGQSAITSIESFNPTLAETLAKIADLATDTEKMLSKTQGDREKTAWKAFAKLIYAHNTPVESEGKDIVDLLNLINSIISAAKDGLSAIQSAKQRAIPRYIVRDSHLDPTKPIVKVVDDSANLPANCEILSGISLDAIFSALLVNFRNYYLAVCGMAETYNTEEMVKDHANLWKIYGLSRS